MCRGTDRGRIFRRSHLNKFFKLSGKIVDGIVAQIIGNLGKIHLPFPDQAFGGIDFHQGKIIDDPIACIIPEKLL